MSLQFIHPLPCVVMMTSFSAKVIFRIASVFTLMSQKDVASDQKQYKLRSLKNSIFGTLYLELLRTFFFPWASLLVFEAMPRHGCFIHVEYKVRWEFVMLPNHFCAIKELH